MNSGDVSGTGNVGGVVGYHYELVYSYDEPTIVKNCYNTGDVSGASNIGGVAGYVETATLENCYSVGKVTSTDHNIGGVLGNNVNSGTVTGCYYDKQKATTTKAIGNWEDTDTVKGLTT